MRTYAAFASAVLLLTSAAVADPGATPTSSDTPKQLPNGLTPVDPPKQLPNGLTPIDPPKQLPNGLTPVDLPEWTNRRPFRLSYESQTLSRELEITRQHYYMPEMVKISAEHWRRAYLALRIRELAEDAHDAATVSRAEAFLKKIDGHFFGLLTEVTATAPEIPGPPTIIAPQDKSPVAIGTSATFKIAPHKDAAHYFCTLFQPKQYWSNWQGGKDANWGSTSDCTIAADDSTWSKFNSGKAHFVARAVVKGKSPTGKEFEMWSQPALIDVTLTGGPAASPASIPPPAPPASFAVGGSK
jgi:hypothetical protein